MIVKHLTPEFGTHIAWNTVIIPIYYMHPDLTGSPITGGDVERWWAVLHNTDDREARSLGWEPKWTITKWYVTNYYKILLGDKCVVYIPLSEYPRGFVTLPTSIEYEY